MVFLHISYSLALQYNLPGTHLVEWFVRAARSEGRLQVPAYCVPDMESHCQGGHCCLKCEHLEDVLQIEAHTLESAMARDLTLTEAKGVKNNDVRQHCPILGLEESFVFLLAAFMKTCLLTVFLSSLRSHALGSWINTWNLVPKCKDFCICTMYVFC